MDGLRTAIAMFTILPVPRRWHADASPSAARAGLRWLPFVGAAIGALAGLPAAAILYRDRADSLLAAAVAVGALALLSRGLHLDGLADTADGLGSRRPADQALAIMRRSDIGPFGVIALVMVLVVDVAAVQTVADANVWRITAALVVAAATGRLAAVHAALPGVAAARPDGFGQLVARGSTPLEAGLLTIVVLAGGGDLAASVGANPFSWILAQVAGLAIALAFRMHVSRRLGGVTGDVFGALIEIATAVSLVGFAVAT